MTRDYTEWSETMPNGHHSPSPGEPRDRRSIDQRVDQMVNRQEDLERRVITNEKAIALLVETSVADGIRAAVKDPATWDALFAALGNRAQDEAGSAAVKGFKWLTARVFWWSIAGLAIYAVGGWTLLMDVLKKIPH